MAIYGLNHLKFGKTTHDRADIMRALNYMIQDQKCAFTETIGGVAPNKHALRDETGKQWDTSRKNARVANWMRISLPREFDEPQMRAAVRHFLVRLTHDGRAFAVATGEGIGTHNPHLHVLFFDRDRTTRKSVQHSSQANSTQRFRKMWEEVGNHHLARNGFKERIDCRSKAEIAKDQAKPIELNTQLDQTTAEVVREKYSVLQAISAVLTQDRHLNHLEHVTHSFRRLQHRLPEDRRQATETQQAVQAATATLAVAQQRLATTRQTFVAEHQRKSGKLKGLRLGLGRLTLFESKARQVAKQKQAELRQAEAVLVRAEATALFHSNARRTAQARVEHTAAELSQVQQHFARFGVRTTPARPPPELAQSVKQKRDRLLETLTEKDFQTAVEAQAISYAEQARLERLKAALERETDLLHRHTRVHALPNPQAETLN